MLIFEAPGEIQGLFFSDTMCSFESMVGDIMNTKTPYKLSIPRNASSNFHCKSDGVPTSAE